LVGVEWSIAVTMECRRDFAPPSRNLFMAARNQPIIERRNPVSKGLAGAGPLRGGGGVASEPACRGARLPSTKGSSSWRAVSPHLFTPEIDLKMRFHSSWVLRGGRRGHVRLTDRCLAFREGFHFISGLWSFGPLMAGSGNRLWLGDEIGWIIVTIALLSYRQ